LQCKCAECSENDAVDPSHTKAGFSGPVEGDFVIVVNWRRCIGLCHLYFYTIVWSCVRMGTILMDRWHDVFEMFECLFAKRCQGNMYVAIVIDPVKVDFDVILSRVVHRNILVAFEGVNEMIGIIT
jgi:hypothetical protein